jgi:RNA polymerase sigma factor (sigma-70 family)
MTPARAVRATGYDFQTRPGDQQAPVGVLRRCSDDELVEHFRGGADEAFRVIHDRYRVRLRAYLREMLAGRPSEDVDDVLQDVFERAARSVMAGGAPVGLRAWLYSVAYNRCIDELRRAPPTSRDVLAMSRGPAGDTTAVVERRAEVERLFGDLRELPELQRSALLMRELQGLSHVELGQALDTTVPAVKSLLVRARVGLAEAEQARNLPCVAVRESLAVTHDRGVKPRPQAARHLRECDSCRSYRVELRRTSRRLAAVVPGPPGIPIGLIGRLLGRSATHAQAPTSAGLAGPGLAGPGIAGSGIAGSGIAGTGVAGSGIVGTGVAGPGIAGPAGIAFAGTGKLAGIVGAAALLTTGAALEQVGGTTGGGRAPARAGARQTSRAPGRPGPLVRGHTWTGIGAAGAGDRAPETSGGGLVGRTTQTGSAGVPSSAQRPGREGPTSSAGWPDRPADGSAGGSADNSPGGATGAPAGGRAAGEAPTSTSRTGPASGLLAPLLGPTPLKTASNAASGAVGAAVGGLGGLGQTISATSAAALKVAAAAAAAAGAPVAVTGQSTSPPPSGPAAGGASQAGSSSAPADSPTSATVGVDGLSATIGLDPSGVSASLSTPTALRTIVLPLPR